MHDENRATDIGTEPRPPGSQRQRWGRVPRRQRIAGAIAAAVEPTTALSVGLKVDEVYNSKRSLGLTAQQKADLAAYLKSL
ncbi:MAG TPA: hypothetical protein VFZ28_05515 [Burkholderiaceae bacterium]|nr:hypothetical protein [Burkholderiaceae bacterium]